MGKTLNILHLVQEYVPAVGGMCEVVKQLSERLVAMGHNVTVATGSHPDRKNSFINGVQVISFPITGNAVMGYKGDTKAYEEFLLSSNFDVVTLFAAQQWTVDLALPLLDKIKGKKVFVPTGFSYLHNPAYADYYGKMKKWLLQFDANVFLSENYQDVEFARANGATKNHLIPNGASEEEFEGKSAVDIRKKFGINDSSLLVLHVGSYTGAKGQPEAAEIFTKAKLPPDATLLLTGHNNSRFAKVFGTNRRYFLLNLLKTFKRRRIIIAELDRAETVAAYKAADIFLFPSQVECSPIVLFECMAAGLPFLSSDVGNAVEIATWGDNGAIIPTKKDKIGWGKVSIKAGSILLESLCADPRKLKQMGENGHKAWKKHYTWQKIAKQYEQLYLGL